MPITLDQIKKDIAEGKTSAIYYSSKTLWWTHLDTDLEESTEIGKKRSEENLNRYLERKDVSAATCAV